eukprot:SAG31_NODE_21037_length_559_cov_1.041304_1_plen_76_part_01
MASITAQPINSFNSPCHNIKTPSIYPPPVEQRALHSALERELRSVAAQMLRIWDGWRAPLHRKVDLVASTASLRAA